MKAPIQIGASGIDTQAVLDAIQAQLQKHRADGTYDDEAVNRADAVNALFTPGDDPRFLHRYLNSLRLVVTVDINDFEITERRTFLRRAHIAFKTLLWKLLRFYTFRLWSQQNQVNQVLLAALIAVEEQFRARIEALEKRVGELEAIRERTASGIVVLPD